MASRFLIDKLGPRAFARDRLRRLLPVILMGMFVVIPPPIYVVHQPILLVAAFFLFPLHLPIPVEVLLLAATTGLRSFVIYEVGIRPFKVSRFLSALSQLPPQWSALVTKRRLPLRASATGRPHPPLIQ